MYGRLTIPMREVDRAVRHQYDRDLLRSYKTARAKVKDNGIQYSDESGDTLDLVERISRAYGYIIEPLIDASNITKKEYYESEQERIKRIEQNTIRWKQQEKDQQKLIEKGEQDGQYDKSPGWVSRWADRAKSKPPPPEKRAKPKRKEDNQEDDKMYLITGYDAKLEIPIIKVTRWPFCVSSYNKPNIVFNIMVYRKSLKTFESFWDR
jgi:hypothetical protein